MSFARMRSRLLSLVLVVWGVTIATFVLANLMPGDPVLALLGEDATPENVAVWRAKLGLDQPLLVRYADWLLNALQGDFGASYRTEEQVFDMILHRLPVTVEILLLTQIVALAIAVPCGIYSAWRSGGHFDRAAMGTSLGLLSMPPFLIGILLIYLFSIQLGLLPATGYASLDEGVLENLQSLLLPVLALALAEIPVYLRLLREDMMQTLQQDYIAVARAKGMPPRRILLFHALRPSSFSLITVVGVNIGRLIGGAIIVEVLFALPGIGQLLIQSVYQQDFLVLQGIVLFVAVAFVLVNAAVDLLYTFLDPRTSHG
ncbi:MAG TPA: ABC transporter permease [Quisquiliibacterium sp.]|jgi:peptide/nickel transport system permease protein|nr:ABC transporter permease [Quisquiliibacterium sp.]HPA90430.1 ABC transporter permease [Quisquiliibacterium sp.]HQD83457.1 ABC transporter permease [Quisquiliibacterium sp.]HQN11949.1 ABC transporter permease [Quisquiliibacterium sp.]HQP68408.1 ABC transporter permease [Quisquiliibacterium sp.]